MRAIDCPALTVSHIRGGSPERGSTIRPDAGARTSIAATSTCPKAVSCGDSRHSRHATAMHSSTARNGTTCCCTRRHRTCSGVLICDPLSTSMTFHSANDPN